MRLRTLFFATVLFASAARAYDPRFDWQTMETPHFQIHFHQGEYRFAARVARAAEAAHARIAPLLDHVPSARTQILLTDDSDFANGSASPVFYDLVHGFAATPDPRSTIADFDDWVGELIDHEYTHILHLDTVLGLPAAANTIFGKIWIPNGGQPGWLIEGMAVFSESEVSAAGRVRASSEEMAVRAEILEGTFPRIDQLSNLPLVWPRANNWYTVGGRFMTWIGDQYGLGALRDLSHDFGGRAIPLAMNISAGRVVGDSYLSLYQQFRADEERQAVAVRVAVGARGATRPEPRTGLGELTHSPRFSPDGRKLYYLNAGADRLPELRAIDLPPCCNPDAPVPQRTRRDDRHLADSFGEGTLAVAPDGRLVYSRTQVYQEFAAIQDLYALDPSTGAEERLTRGARASEPDVAPDGAVAFSQRQPGGRTAIAVLDPGAKEPRIVFESPDVDPVASPRWSPRGDRIAFLHHRQGSWDVRIVGRGGGEPQDVTHDRAFDRDPAWTPDGEYVLFSSDRTGVYDVYAARLSDGTVWQVTNVVFGAFEPSVSPDGSQLALVSYSSRGYDVARMPFDPAKLLPASAPIQDRMRPRPAPEPPQELYPVRKYTPWATLRPYWWLPFAATDAQGTTVGAITSGFDVADRHEYVASAWWGIDSRQPGWDLSYTYKGLYPNVTATFARDVETADYSGPGYTQNVIAGTLGVSFPFTQVERSHVVAAEYELTHYAQNSPVTSGSFTPPPGLAAAVAASYVYSDARRFVRSISPEEGQRFAIVARLADRALGSDFNFRQVSASYARFFALPWTWRNAPLHHVFAARFSGGIARGDQSERHLFTLGGFDEGDPVRSILNPASAPVRILRGFRGGSFAGEAYVLGTFEYRFPLLTVETGAWTLPVYLRRLHAAVFSDVGDAWMPFNDGLYRTTNPAAFFERVPFRLHAGAGVELRAEVVLGYALPTDVRFGCAHGLESSAASILDCYAAIGGVF
jgi:hypothetical protein